MTDGGNRFGSLRSDDRKKTDASIIRPSALLEKLKGKGTGLKTSVGSLAPGSDGAAKPALKLGGLGGLGRISLGGSASLRPGGKQGTFKSTGSVLPSGSRRTKKRRGDPTKVYTPSQLKSIMRHYQDFPYKGIDGVFGGTYGKDHWYNFQTEKKEKDERQPTIINSKKKSKKKKKVKTEDEKAGGDEEEEEESSEEVEEQQFTNRAAKKWEPPSVRRARLAKEAESNKELKDQLRMEEIQGTIRGYLNKMTPEKFDTLSDQLIQWLDENIENSKQLKNVIAHIFEKSINEPKYGGMYAQLCKKLHRPDNTKLVFTEMRNGKPEKVAFRRNLLNQCQKEFEKGNAAPDVKGSRKKREIAIAKQKKLMTGTIKFIGQLYNEDLLPDRIMHECIKHLLSNNNGNPSDEDLEAVCNLTKSSNKKLDKEGKGKKLMNQYFNRLKSYADSPGYQLRTQILIRNLVDLRSNNWQKSKWQKNEELKKLSEVRANFAREKGITNLPNIELQEEKQKKKDTNLMSIDGGYGAAAPMMPVQAVRSALNQRNIVTGGRRRNNDRYQHQLSTTYAEKRQASGRRGKVADDDWVILDSPKKDEKKGEPAPAPKKRTFKLLSSSKAVVDIASVERLAGPEKEPSPEPAPRDETPSQPGPSSAGADPNLKVRRGGGKAISKDDAKEQLQGLLLVYWESEASAPGVEQALKDIRKLMGSSTKGWEHKQVAEWIIDMALNAETKINRARPLAGKLLVTFITEGVITADEVQQGFTMVLEFFEDMMIDIPKFPAYIAELLAEVLVTKTLGMEFMVKGLSSTEFAPNGACSTTVTDKYPLGLRANFLADLVNAMLEVDEDADIGELLTGVDIAADYMGITDGDQKAQKEAEWIQNYNFGDIL